MPFSCQRCDFYLDKDAGAPYECPNCGKLGAFQRCEPVEKAEIIAVIGFWQRLTYNEEGDARCDTLLTQFEVSDNTAVEKLQTDIPALNPELLFTCKERKEDE